MAQRKQIKVLSELKQLLLLLKIAQHNFILHFALLCFHYNLKHDLEYRK